MSRIIDNDELTLASALNEVLPHSKAFDACVGYFNLRGWGLLREAISKMQPTPDGRPPVRLLIGMAISPGEALRSRLEGKDQLPDIERATKLAAQAVASFAEQLIWGKPTNSDRANLRKLRSDLEAGKLQIKFVGREPLHAKLYIAHLEGGMNGYRAVVGSSNFTMAGLSKQGELSLEETDQQLTSELSDWFNARWEDLFSIDVTHQLLDVLEEAWIRETQPSPYHVYLRLAYELSKDAREGLTLDIPNQFSDVLLPHQESAVRVATRLLERQGIAVIGDVVGLGKTLTGAAIAATTGESVLVISPKNLTTMWKEHLDRYDIPGRVMSLSMVAKELPDLRRYKLVLIDESHNLRNRQRKAWDAIHDYISENDSKVVLLTATMFNARHRDIGGQLGLKLEMNQPLGVRPERLIADQGEIEVASKTGGHLDSLSAFERSEFNEDWQRLLSEFLIRRTRKFIETNYGIKDPKTGETYLEFKDGTRFHFPKRNAEPLRYVGGESDPNDRLATEEIFDLVSELSYARHNPGLYLTDDFEAQDKATEELISDLIKAKSSASGFIRTTALKRLTSSAYAFMLTINRMIARNAVFEYALLNNKQLPIGNFQDAFFDDLNDLDIDEDDDSSIELDLLDGAWGVNWSQAQWLEHAAIAHEALFKKKPKNVRWAPPEMFNTEEMKIALASDSIILQGLLDEYGTWDYKEDGKLKALGELIEKLEPHEKVLIFSEYKDTVDYIHEYLPNYTKRALESVSGKSGDPLRIARRFAPVANANLGGLPNGEPEIDVLVTTDVLSEGQNLQDAAIIINWDLPWTIIKVIQRAGRVDRVGQKAKEIRVISFLPQDGVESVINLSKRLVARLKNNNEIFGGGEKFFDEDEDLVELRGLYDGTVSLDDEEGEVDAASLALEVWQSASDDDRRQALDLPEMVYSTKSATEKSSPSVITYGQTDSGTDLLVRTSENKVSFITPSEALEAMKSLPNSVAVTELPDHIDQLGLALDAMTDQVEKSMVLVHHGLRKRLHDFLAKQVNRVDIPHQTAHKAIELLEAVMVSPIQDSVKSDVSGVLRSAKTLGDDHGQLERLITMHEEHKLLEIRDHGADRIQIITSMGFNPNV